MEKKIPYIKANACGNDFLIIEAKHAPLDVAAVTRRICDRVNGIGADGVEWVSNDASGAADILARLVNADGSEAEISGNGTRCVAAHWMVSNLSKAKPGALVRVRTGAGVKACKLIGAEGTRYEFEMAMGAPTVSGEATVSTSLGDWRGWLISMGNPHFSVLVEEFPQDWQRAGAAIQKDSRFTHGVNVEFVKVLAAHAIEARFFERGVGETQSSGTGSCAAAVAAMSAGRVGRQVHVAASGGAQTVRWNGDVFLTGPTELEKSGDCVIG